MWRITERGLVAGVGAYGPFRDKPEQEPIPYIEFVPSTGGVYRATVAQGLTPPEALSTVEATFEAEPSGQGSAVKLRLTAYTPSLDSVADAA